MTEESKYVWVDPERCGGVPCFRGTRIFVSILFDYLEAGDSVKDFLDQYPDLDPELVYGYLHAHMRQLELPAA